MAKIIFDSEAMKVMSLFETLTQAKLKDCILEHDHVIFIVQENEIGKAIGKQGSNVKRLEKALNRKIKIVEFNSQLLNFIKSLVYPARIADIQEQDGIVTIQAPDMKTRGLLIGRNASNLRNYEKIAQRYFPALNEIKVR